MFLGAEQLSKVHRHHCQTLLSVREGGREGEPLCSACKLWFHSRSTKVESYSRPSRNALMAANRKFREVASGMACSTSSVPVPGIVVTRVASLPVGVSEPRNLSAIQCFALSSKCPSVEPPLIYNVVKALLD